MLGHQDPVAAFALLDRFPFSFRLGAWRIGSVFLGCERSHEHGVLGHDPLEALHVAQIMADSVLPSLVVAHMWDLFAHIIVNLGKFQALVL